MAREDLAQGRHDKGRRNENVKASIEDLFSIIERLPDEVSTETIVAELLFKQSVIQGLEQLDRGEVASHDEAKERLAPWLKSSGPSPR